MVFDTRNLQIFGERVGHIFTEFMSSSTGRALRWLCEYSLGCDVNRLFNRKSLRIRSQVNVLDSQTNHFGPTETAANHQTNAHLRQPVRSDDVINVLSEFDCGLITIPPTNYPYANCLPNKFFQYIQARIPFITGPIPEIGDLVTELGIGWVSETFEPRD